jgi:hypothetical protein
LRGKDCNVRTLSSKNLGEPTAKCRGGSAWWSVGLIGFLHDAQDFPEKSGGHGFKSRPRHSFFFLYLDVPRTRSMSFSLRDCRKQTHDPVLAVLELLFDVFRAEDLVEE